MVSNGLTYPDESHLQNLVSAGTRLAASVLSPSVSILHLLHGIFWIKLIYWNASSRQSQGVLIPLPLNSYNKLFNFDLGKSSGEWEW